MNTHFLYTPFTGLGLYQGFRGNRWLRNRISVFKEIVVPSLQNQTNKNFVLWVSWRPEERFNPYVKELWSYLQNIKEFKTVFTYSGVCFWDDKYSDEEAHSRLAQAIHESAHTLVNEIGTDTVLMTIQPSDDVYHLGFVEEIQTLFEKTDFQAIGYNSGYITNYKTGEICEYTPKTNPPFFTLKFPKDIFLDPIRHMKYSGPYKSHEYVGDHMKYLSVPKRGFCVGTHGENISTHFNHPYAGRRLEGEEREKTLEAFGINPNQRIKIHISVRKWVMKKLPYGWQRKLRYWFGECLYNRFYNFIRG